MTPQPASAVQEPMTLWTLIGAAFLPLVALVAVLLGLSCVFNGGLWLLIFTLPCAVIGTAFAVFCGFQAWHCWRINRAAVQAMTPAQKRSLAGFRRYTAFLLLAAVGNFLFFGSILLNIFVSFYDMNDGITFQQGALAVSQGNKTAVGLALVGLGTFVLVKQGKRLAERLAAIQTAIKGTA